MSSPQNWYIVKTEAGNCQIIAAEHEICNRKCWGPFQTQEEAIARRVGLIRAGKCQPRSSNSP